MKENSIMVSIICLTYNHEKYIEDCINGFLMQKVDFNYEIIIHDDCSTDKTSSIVKKYAYSIPKIKYILQTENQYSKGVDIVKEYILPLVKGRYIAFCDGDDLWIDDMKLSKQVSFLEQNPEFSACVHNTFFHRCDKPCKNFPMIIYNVAKDLTFDDICKWNTFGYQNSSLLARKEFVLDAPFGSAEWAMALYLSLCGKVFFMNRVMSEYRYRSSQNATRMDVFSIEAAISEMENTLSILKQVENYVVDRQKKKR